MQGEADERTPLTLQGSFQCEDFASRCNSVPPWMHVHVADILAAKANIHHFAHRQVSRRPCSHTESPLLVELGDILEEVVGARLALLQNPGLGTLADLA